MYTLKNTDGLGLNLGRHLILSTRPRWTFKDEFSLKKFLKQLDLTNLHVYTHGAGLGLRYEINVRHEINCKLKQCRTI